jgi:hypothetical protein
MEREGHQVPGGLPPTPAERGQGDEVGAETIEKVIAEDVLAPKIS